MNVLPWELGAIARAAGVPRERSPYHSRTVSARAWERGWDHEDRAIAGEAGYAPAEVIAEEEEEARA